MALFNGIDEQTSKDIEKLLRYTDREREIIDRCSYGILFGFPLKIATEKFSTIDGIQEQLDNFSHDRGILFYMTVVDGIATMDKIPVIKTS